FNNVDAGLKVFPSVVVKNQSALFARLVIRREGVNKWARKRYHSPLTGKPFIHSALEYGLREFCLRRCLRAEQSLAHVVHGGVPRWIAVLKDNSEITKKRGGQHFRQDAQEVRLPGALIADERNDVM